MLHTSYKESGNNWKITTIDELMYIYRYFIILIMFQTMTSRYTDGQLFIYMSARVCVNCETTKSRMKSWILGILSTLTRQRKRLAGVRVRSRTGSDVHAHIHRFYIHRFGMAVVGHTGLYCWKQYAADQQAKQTNPH